MPPHRRLCPNRTFPTDRFGVLEFAAGSSAEIESIYRNCNHVSVDTTRRTARKPRHVA